MKSTSQHVTLVELELETVNVASDMSEEKDLTVPLA